VQGTMLCTRRNAGSAAVAIALLLGTVPGRAQALGETQAGVVRRVVLTNSDSRLSVRVDLVPSTWRPGDPIRSYTPGCVDTCIVMAPPGTYRVLMRDPEHHRLIERATLIEVNRDARYELRPPLARRRSRWLTVAAISSITLALGGAAWSYADESSADDGPTGIALLLTTSALVMTPVSWSMYAHVRHPIVRERPLAGPGSVAP